MNTRILATLLLASLGALAVGATALGSYTWVVKLTRGLSDSAAGRVRPLRDYLANP